MESISIKERILTLQLLKIVQHTSLVNPETKDITQYKFLMYKNDDSNNCNLINFFILGNIIVLYSHSHYIGDFEQSCQILFEMWNVIMNNRFLF